MRIRKVLTIKDVVHSDPFGHKCDPITRIAVAAVVHNPCAGGYIEDLSELFTIGGALGEQLMAQIVGELSGPPVSYGKAAIVGAAGDMEQGGAMIHPKLGKPMRAANCQASSRSLREDGNCRRQWRRLWHRQERIGKKRRRIWSWVTLAEHKA